MTGSPGDAAAVALEIVGRRRGRAVLAEPDGALHLGDNYDILRSRDAGGSWQRIGALPRSPWRRAAELSRLACRLIRQEVRALAHLGGGRYVAANREGIFHGRDDGGTWSRSAIVGGAEAPFLPPMRLGVGPGGVVLCGEYGNPTAPRPNRLFASRDGGRCFECVHTFAPGEVFHVHNVCYDRGLDHYWVLVGDFAQEPGIGILSSDLERFEWFRKGEQRYRAVELFDLGDQLLYATDTHLERNGLITLDKRTGRLERHRDFDGSCIYACRFGDLFAITTTVEESSVNRATAATLWLSRDGFEWKRAWTAEKDGWSPKYFQFGSIVLPSGDLGHELVAFSGQAVRGIDGETLIARVVGQPTP